MYSRRSSTVGPVVAALLVVPGLAIAQTRTPLKVAAPRTTLQIYTPPVGPAPQSISFDFQRATHIGVSAKVDWATAPNAVSYSVSRQMVGDPTCCNASSGVLTTPTWTDNGLLKEGTYLFTVTVNYADGSVGSGSAGIGAAGVENPSVIVHDIGTGRVRLYWANNIPGAVGFMVGGPGFGTGKQVPFASPMSGAPPGLPPLTEVGPLPVGTHTWTVATVYGNNMGILSPPSEWTTVTHNVSYGNGRYRISLERFQSLTDVPEDLLRSDGRGNEIYVTTQVNEYGLNGQLASQRMTRTPTFGDAWNYPNRIRAGSASNNGGVRNGDEYPAAVQLVSQLATPSVTNLPYQLWEGDLTEVSGAVIISPSIWEADEDDRLFPHYMTFQTTVAANLARQQTLSMYVPMLNGNGTKIPTWNPVRGCNGIGMFNPPQLPWGDVPIDFSGSSYCPVYVAINWRVAQDLTRVNPAAVMDVPFQTGNGQYKLYLRVEKVGAGATAVAAPITVRRRWRP